MTDAHPVAESPHDYPANVLRLRRLGIDTYQEPVVYMTADCHGDRDTTAPLEGVRRLLEHHPAWRLSVISDGDHHLPLHETARCIALIESFLKDSPRSAIASR